MEIKHWGIRVDADTLKKFSYVAKYEGRSGNGQVLYLIRKCIEAFEDKHGEIDLKEKN